MEFPLHQKLQGKSPYVEYCGKFAEELLVAFVAQPAVLRLLLQRTTIFVRPCKNVPRKRAEIEIGRNLNGMSGVLTRSLLR